MKKRHYVMLACIMTLISTACQKHMVTQDAERIYRMEGIEIMTWDPQHPVNNLEQGCWGINPKVAFEEPFDLESRQFYEALDTALVFKGRLVITGANLYLKTWELLDMRISSVDVTALADYDKSHPAGSSLNDVLTLSYRYKRGWTSQPLSDIKYGDVMLGDYIHNPGYTSYPGLTLSDGKHRQEPLIPIEVRITDAFGREFVAKSTITE